MDDRHFILTRWLKQDGEFVQLDEPICELDTDMTTVVLPAWAGGILRQLAAPGDAVSAAREFARIDSPPKS